MKTRKTKGPAGAIAPAINCAHGELMAPERLRPNPKNPNKHPAEQLRIYAKVLMHQGWRKAVVVSRQTGLIVTGEGAWRTAVKEGWPTIPVDHQDFKTPADEIRFDDDFGTRHHGREKENLKP